MSFAAVIKMLSMASSIPEVDISKYRMKAPSTANVEDVVVELAMVVVVVNTVVAIVITEVQ